MPHDALFLLESCSKQTVLSTVIKHRLIGFLTDVEKRFGTGMKTPILTQSIETYEILAQPPVVFGVKNVASLWKSEIARGRIDIVLHQLKSLEICTHSWAILGPLTVGD